MSMIAVEGLNLKTTLSQVCKMMSRCIHGQFKTAGFEKTDRSDTKTCYLKLADDLDPLKVVQTINMATHGKKKIYLNAYIPESDNFPDLPRNSKNKATPVTKNCSVLQSAHTEIMTELQYKYTGLYNLSSKGSHTLLEAIGVTIFERLKQLMATGDEDTSDAFKLTAKYRKMHPHFGDFQLILGTLHRLEDAAGAPRTQLVESELCVTEKDIKVVDNIPYTKAQEAVTKYTARILKKLEEHVGSYDLTANSEDSPEEAARKKVQAQLAKMIPYLPSIMKQVVLNHFAVDHRKSRFHKMRMYGEPYLASKEQTMPLLKRVAAQRVSRWKATYNLLVFEVPFDCYPKIMALDGTNLGGCKLVIRSSIVPIYRVKETRKRPLEPALAGDDEDYAVEL